MKRASRLPVLLVLTLLFALLSTAGYLAWTRFFQYQPRVDTVRATIRATDVPLSMAAHNALVGVVSEREMAWIASKGLYQDLGIYEVPSGEWHLRGALWTFLLPRRLTGDELLTLYAHYLPFEGQGGASVAARLYFGKDAGELTHDEALGLVVIARSPTRYSPIRHPAAYARAVVRLDSSYQLRHK